MPNTTAPIPEPIIDPTLAQRVAAKRLELGDLEARARQDIDRVAESDGVIAAARRVQAECARTRQRLTVARNELAYLERSLALHNQRVADGLVAGA